METIRATEKAAREAQAKADNIDAAVYDLKAVNPNDNTRPIPDPCRDHRKHRRTRKDRCRSLGQT